MNYIEQLTPQMNDYNKLSLSWLPNLMFFNQPNFLDLKLLTLTLMDFDIIIRQI